MPRGGSRGILRGACKVAAESPMCWNQHEYPEVPKRDKRGNRQCEECLQDRLQRQNAARYGSATIDEVVVDRLMHGEPAPSTIHERRLAADELLRIGITIYEVARRVGVSVRTVERYSARRAR